jgi:hypothetical protein
LKIPRILSWLKIPLILSLSKDELRRGSGATLGFEGLKDKRLLWRLPCTRFRYRSSP